MVVVMEGVGEAMCIPAIIDGVPIVLYRDYNGVKVIQKKSM